MTLKDMLRDLGTLKQLSILAGADVLLADKGGRYYAGQLTDAEVLELRS